MTLLAALLLASTICSPSGEMCVVIGDERAGALHRVWPGGYEQPIAEFTFGERESLANVLVANDGRFVTHGELTCGADAELLTIRDASGALVRTLRVRELLTARDQQWLCRGADEEVRYSIGDTLRMIIRGEKDREHTIEIDLATGEAPKPERNYCPAALIIEPEADDGLPRIRIDRDVAPIDSHALLDRAVRRVMPEYPVVADKARVSGRVGVQLVIGTDGKVESATIVKPLPFGIAEAVEEAMLQWEFAPDATRVSGVVAFRFEIVRGHRLVTMR